jgi:hypothetical protein
MAYGSGRPVFRSSTGYIKNISDSYTLNSTQNWLAIFYDIMFDGNVKFEPMYAPVLDSDCYHPYTIYDIEHISGYACSLCLQTFRKKNNDIFGTHCCVPRIKHTPKPQLIEMKGDVFVDLLNFHISKLSIPQRKYLMYAIEHPDTNCYITGSAGCGKSHLLRVLIACFYEKFGIKGVGVITTTHVSANVIGGSTMHSFLGLDENAEFEKIVPDEHINYLREFKPRVIENISTLICLVVDEIGQTSSHALNLIESIFKKLRAIKVGKEMMFGGVRLIVVGDPLQLPPMGESYLF